MTDKRWNESPLRRMTPKGPGQVESAEETLIRQVSSDTLHFQKVARTEGAIKKRQAGKADHVARAAALSAEGLSAPVVGIRMATDEGRPEKPYSERQVRKWLAVAKKG